MSFPNEIITYPTRINKNASGWFVGPEYFNVPSSSPYEIYLDHVPKDSATTTIGASGGAAWTEVFDVSELSAGKYYVDYDYGQITFHSGNSGAAVEAEYYNLGDDIMAEHVNYLQDEVYSTQTEFGLKPKGVYGNVSERLNAMQADINDKMPDASGINGDWITDDTVRAGALKDDIKGALWVSEGRPVLTDITTHISNPIAAHQSSAVSAEAPGSTTISSVQDHINSGGSLTKTDSNPHGVTIEDTLTGDLDIVPYTLIATNVETEAISASGNTFSLNSQGPDRDQYLLFYNAGDPSSRHLRWNDSDDKFELNDEILVHGDISASGNFIPDASGTRSVGTQAIAFSEVNAVTGRFDTAYITDLYVSAGTLYIGGQTIDQKIQALSADWSDSVDSDISPDASGTRNIGTQAVSFDSGNFDEIYAVSYKTGSATGANGSFTSNDGKTITVQNGIIVSIV